MLEKERQVGSPYREFSRSRASVTVDIASETRYVFVPSAIAYVSWVPACGSDGGALVPGGPAQAASWLGVSTEQLQRDPIWISRVCLEARSCAALARCTSPIAAACAAERVPGDQASRVFRTSGGVRSDAFPTLPCAVLGAGVAARPQLTGSATRIPVEGEAASLPRRTSPFF